MMSKSGDEDGFTPSDGHFAVLEKKGLEFHFNGRAMREGFNYEEGKIRMLFMPPNGKAFSRSNWSCGNLGGNRGLLNNKLNKIYVYVFLY